MYTTYLRVQVLGRKDEGGIARMHAGILNVLGNEVSNHGTVVGDGVHLDLLGVLNVLGDDHRVLLRHVYGLVEVVGQVVLRVNGVHSSPGQDVRRTDQDGVGYPIAELSRLLNACELLPSRLVDLNAVEHARELVSILRGVNHLWRGTKNLDVHTVQRQGDVVGGLATHRNDNTTGVLEVIDVHDTLDRDVLEVKAVSLIIIGGHGLGVELEVRLACAAL